MGNPQPKSRSLSPSPLRPSYPLVLETLTRYREEALGTDPVDLERLDRHRVLTRLAAELATDAEELARQGFDRAYRLIVEGV